MQLGHHSTCRIALIALPDFATSVGLGTSLGVLLRKRPDLLQTSTAARVLQLLLEQQQLSTPEETSLSTALGSSGLVDKLVESVKRPDSLLQGEARILAKAFLLVLLCLALQHLDCTKSLIIIVLYSCPPITT